MDKQVAEHINAVRQSGLNGTADFIQELVNSNQRINKKLRLEMSKNAFIEVTGKSLKGIWSDGIVNAVETLSPEFDYQEDSSVTIKVNELIAYSIELAHK